jgi:oxalate decarboxylase/phosphoglucose isomerase-like protein (cupin superfamily)
MLRVIVIAAMMPLATAQDARPRIFYFPKPVRATPYVPPMKPVHRLAEIKAKHEGQQNWSEPVIADSNTAAAVISSPPGSRVDRHLHADSPEWWVVQEGTMRFEIEGPDGKMEVIEARKGTYVFAPERRLHSFEVVGDRPAIRFEVTLANTTSIYERPPSAKSPGIEYLPVTLTAGANPSDVPTEGGRAESLHWSIEDQEKAHTGKSAWTVNVMRKNRVRGNLICGHATDNPKRRAGDRGHFHADFAEFWIVMRGRLNWRMEGQAEAISAAEGDIVYAPARTFHAPEFAGDGLACRLTSSTFPGANHIFDVH